MNEIDLVPESNIDEEIENIQDLFVMYFNNKTEENLQLLLSKNKQMISELYHTCNENEQKNLLNFIIN